MDLTCYKTEDYEFHIMVRWVFIEEDGNVAHMQTNRIKYKCFNCGKVWIKDLKRNELLVSL